MDLSIYYEQICKYKSLNRTQEQDLFKKYYDTTTSEKRKADIRDTIIKSNLRFAFKTAKKYSKNEPEQFEELIAAGNEGLLVGFNKYDPNSGVKFLSYAGWWVLQRILKEMSKFRIVALPIWKQQLSVKINRYIDKHESTPTLEELCEQFPNFSKKDIKELFETRYLTYFLDDMTDSDEYLDPVQEEVDPELETENVRFYVKRLPEPHRTVILMSFGIEDGVEHSNKDILDIVDIDRKDLKNVKKEAFEMLEKLIKEN